MKFKRIFLLVLDSIGVGEAKDAIEYKDEGANTLKHIMDNYDLFIPNLTKLGFLNTLSLEDKEGVDAYFSIARPTNKGKDALSSYYELMGIKTDNTFNDIDNGLPAELIEFIEKSIGRRIIANKRGNTDEILKEFGEISFQYGSLIIYTTDGSTLKVAAHEAVIPLSELYRICEMIRKITEKYYKIGRIVAKPFLGKPGNFRKSRNRKEFTLDPPSTSLLEKLEKNGLTVISMGKVNDIFNGKGVTKKVTAKSNTECLDKLLEIMNKNFTGFCFANISNYDYLYENGNTIENFAKTIEDFDVELPLILNNLNNDDLLIITADHGSDLTLEKSHTRENVPIIIYSRIFKEPKRLEILETLSDVGATIAENFEVDDIVGTSLLEKLK